MTPYNKIIQLIESTEESCWLNGCIESERCQAVIEGMTLAAAAVAQD